MYTSGLPDSSDWYATQRPSGENFAHTSLAEPFRKSEDAPSFFRSMSITSRFPGVLEVEPSSQRPSGEHDSDRALAARPPTRVGAARWSTQARKMLGCFSR